MEHYFEKLSHSKIDEATATNDQLVENTLKYVVQLAHQYKGEAALEDLVAEGNIGLMRAAELFDRTKGTKFITYARFHIKYRMRRFVRKNYLVHGGRGKTKIVYMDSGFADFDSLHDRLYVNDSSTNTPYEDAFGEIEGTMMVDKAMASLNEKERNVIEHKFGMNGKVKMSIKALSVQMKMSPFHITNIAKHSLMKMRKAVQASS